MHNEDFLGSVTSKPYNFRNFNLTLSFVREWETRPKRRGSHIEHGTREDVRHWLRDSIHWLGHPSL